MNLRLLSLTLAAAFGITLAVIVGQRPPIPRARRHFVVIGRNETSERTCNLVESVLDGD